MLAIGSAAALSLSCLVLPGPARPLPFMPGLLGCVHSVFRIAPGPASMYSTILPTCLRHAHDAMDELEIKLLALPLRFD